MLRIQASVGGWPPRVVDQPSGGNRFAPLVGGVDFPTGDGGRRHVEQNGIASLERNAVGDGVAAQHGAPRAGGRHAGNVVPRHHGDTTGPGRAGGEVTGGTNVPRVPQSNPAHPGVSRLGNRQVNGPSSPHLPQCRAAIEHRPCRPLAFDHWLGCSNVSATFQLIEVARQQLGAVREDPEGVGFDQGPGGDLGGGRGEPNRAKSPFYERLQIGRRDPLVAITHGGVIELPGKAETGRLPGSSPGPPRVGPDCDETPHARTEKHSPSPENARRCVAKGH